MPDLRDTGLNLLQLFLPRIARPAGYRLRSQTLPWRVLGVYHPQRRRFTDKF